MTGRVKPSPEPAVIDADRWDPLAGFDLISRSGETRFRVGEALAKAGAPAVEAAVEGGFPEGTELEYAGGAWLVVLPFEGVETALAPAGPVDLPPAPGYEWVESDGRQVLCPLGNGPRPVLHPPGGQPGWRWRPVDDLGWVLVPPADVRPAPAPIERPAAPEPAASVEVTLPADLAPRVDVSLPSDPAPVVPPRAAVPPPPDPPLAVAEPPVAEPPVAVAVPPPVVAPPAPAPAAPLPEPSPTEPPAPAARRRGGRLLDVLGVVLVCGGVALAAVLLLDLGGGGAADDLPAGTTALAELLGVPPDEFAAAFNTHADSEVVAGEVVPDDPLAQIVGSALVLVDLDESDVARVAAAAAGTVEPGQQLVLVLELADNEAAPSTRYRFGFLDAASPVLAAPDGGDGVARVELQLAYLFAEPDGVVVAMEPNRHTTAAAGAFAVREGRFVALGLARDSLAGTTVFGQAMATRSGAPPTYTLTPPYEVN